MALPTKLLIDGELLDGSSLLNVVDPSTGDTFIDVPLASHAQVCCPR